MRAPEVPDIEDDDEVELVPLDLPLDRETMSWLAQLANITGAAPSSIVASMLRDIRKDDEAAHRLLN
jgi:hypothetical protein